MPKRELTTRERWWQAVRFGALDRLPFWPKLDAAYPQAQRAPFNSMTISEIHAWLGSDEHAHIVPCVREVRASTSLLERKQGGHSVTIYSTPYGETRLIQQFDPTSQAWHPMEFPIHDLDTIKLMTAFYEDANVILDEDVLEKNRMSVQAYGENAFTFTVIGESPLMFFVEWLAGVENAHYLLNDYPDEVGHLFNAIHRMLKTKTKLLAQHTPSDVLYMIENTSTTLISPEQYRKYCYHHITDYGNKTRAYNRYLFLHM